METEIISDLFDQHPRLDTSLIRLKSTQCSFLKEATIGAK